MTRSGAACALVLAFFGVLLLTACGGGRRSGAEDPLTGSLTGRVELGGGAEDFSGILVYLAGTSLAARTDAEGRYTLSGVGAGTFRVRAEKDGYAPQEVATVILSWREDGSRERDLSVAVLEPVKDEGGDPSVTLGSIAGAIGTDGGENLADVRVRLVPGNILTVTDEAGQFKFLNVSPGNYSLQVSRTGYDPLILDVSVRPGQETQLARATLIPLEAPAEDAGEPLEEEDVAGSEMLLTDADLVGDRSIEGTVAFASPGTVPLTDVLVAIDNSSYVVSPDSDGRFRLLNLPAGVYRVLAYVDGYTIAERLVDLTRERSASVQFRLTPLGDGAPAPAPEEPVTSLDGAGAITGRIASSDADSVLGARVSILGTQFAATAARNGAFIMEGVPAGAYSVEVRTDGFDPLLLDNVQVADGEITDLGTITLERTVDHPRVVQTSPAGGSRNVQVAQDLTISVRFDRTMDAAAVRRAVTVSPLAAYSAFMGRGTHPLADAETLVLVLSNMDAAQPIRFNTTYRITVAESAADPAGNPLREPYTFSLTTGAPGITGTQPADGSRDVYASEIRDPIAIYVNARVKADSVNDNSIRIRPRAEAQPRFAVTDDPRTGFSTIFIYGKFSEDTNYTVTVGRRVSTMSGQPLGNTPYTFRFRTVKPRPVESSPQVIR